jgi:hypothetical protein
VEFDPAAKQIDVSEAPSFSRWAPLVCRFHVGCASRDLGFHGGIALLSRKPLKDRRPAIENRASYFQKFRAAALASPSRQGLRRHHANFGGLNTWNKGIIFDHHRAPSANIAIDDGEFKRTILAD